MLGQYLVTYLKYKETWFFVSTVNRMCSSDYPRMFSETIVREWDAVEKVMGNFLYELSGAPNSSTMHLMAVNELVMSGKIEEKDQ